MPGITISSEYGAGGEQVAPAVAERLGFTFLDRAISSQVAQELNLSPDEVVEGERKRGFGERFFRSFAPIADLISADPAVASDGPDDFQVMTERIMRAALQDGAVIFGRAGAAAMHDEPQVLRVRLYGSLEERVESAQRHFAVDESTARADVERVDHARAKYMHHLYGRDINDRSLYHLMINTPDLQLEECVQIIVAAYRALLAASSTVTT